MGTRNPTILLARRQTLQVLKPGHQYNFEQSLEASKIPPGHPEGIFDAMGNIYRGMAKAIRGEEVDSGLIPVFTTEFAD